MASGSGSTSRKERTRRVAMAKARGSARAGLMSRDPRTLRGLRFPSVRFNPHDFEMLRGDDYEDLSDDSDAERVLPPRRTIDAREFLGKRWGRCYFVETDVFQMVVGIFIAVNILAITDSMLHNFIVRQHSASSNHSIWRRVAGQSFLCTYLVELVVRLAHYGPSSFFFGHEEGTAVNWLDFVTVLLGVLDQWVLAYDVDVSPVLALRGLRFLQPRRSCRLFCDCFLGDLSWTESASWEWLVGGVIGFNAILMGLETEVESPWWDYIECCLLAFFTLEIAVRLRRGGLSFFTGDDMFWNLLDFGIVLTGTVDQWLVPLFTYAVQLAHGSSMDQDAAGQGPDLGKTMRVFRMLRLMRILRLLRLVKAVRPLYNLATGIACAMQGMFWVLVLTMVALYAFAILATSFFGHHGYLVGAAYTQEQSELFGDVLTSMFTLFGLMNGQYWAKVAPVMNVVPWTKPVYVIFTVLSSWALLSVMTGVVSDNMLKVRHEEEEKDHQLEAKLRSEVSQRVVDILQSVDFDDKGILTREAYRELLSSRFHMDKLKSVANIYRNDLVSMFDWIDVHGEGKMDIGEFLQGFDWLNHPVNGKTLLKLEFSMKRRMASVEKAIIDLQENVISMEAKSSKQAADLIDLLKGLRDRCKLETERALRDAEANRALAQRLRDMNET